MTPPPRFGGQARVTVAKLGGSGCDRARKTGDGCLRQPYGEAVLILGRKAYLVRSAALTEAARAVIAPRCLQGSPYERVAVRFH